MEKTGNQGIVRTEKQKTAHLLKPKNWRTLITTTKEREKDKGVKIDYVKVASVVEYGASMHSLETK